MAHAYLQAMASRGHDVTVMCNKPTVDQLDGVKLVKEPGYDDLDVAYKRYDVIITHLGKMGACINKCKKLGKPLIIIQHNTYKYGGPQHNDWIGIVYNTEWAKKVLSPIYDNPSVVCRPIPDIEKYMASPDQQGRKYITLVNMNQNKGGEVLRDIATALPDYPFLGVEGSYGKQLLEQPPNVEMVENTPDMHTVYKATRILIMPSEYECFGRTGLEAMAMGIPVLANPTPGILESMGDAPWHIDRAVDGKPNTSEWVKAIQQLYDDPRIYNLLVHEGQKQVNTMIDQAKVDVDQFENFLNQMSDEKNQVQSHAGLRGN